MIDIMNLSEQVIEIGRRGENLATTVEFDVSEMLSMYPDAFITLWVQRQADIQPYIADADLVEGVLTWNVTKYDTARAGMLKFEIRATVGDILAKTVTGRAHVEQALANDGTNPPASSESWADRVIEAAEFKKAEIKADVLAEVEPAVNAAETATENANSAAQELRDAAARGDFKGEKGDKGDKGDRGPQGVKGDTGATGPQGARGADGVPGAKGDKGDPGRDGSDASVTSANIATALGYTPANAEEQSRIFESITDIRNTKADKSELPEVPVKSVSAGGSALTPDADGNVNVPIASSTNVGVIKIGAGLYIRPASGEMILDYATAQNIANRNPIDSGVPTGGGLYPVTLGFFDLGVRSALTDGRGRAYTAEEQAAARQRINAIGDEMMELIADMTVDSEAALLRIDRDINGQPFSLKKAKLIIQSPTLASGVTATLFCNETSKYLLGSQSNFFSSNSTRVVDVNCFNGRLSLSTIRADTHNLTSGYVASVQSSLAGLQSDCESMDNFRITAASGTTIPIDAKIIIYGVRA